MTFTSKLSSYDIMVLQYIHDHISGKSKRTDKEIMADNRFLSKVITQLKQDKARSEKDESEH